MPKMKTNWLAPSLVVLLLAQACGGAANRESTLPRVSGGGGLADARELGMALRQFYSLAPGDALRGPLRDQILAYLARSTEAIVGAGDYAKGVEHLASMTALYEPEELATGPLSPLLEPPARFVLERGSSTGDEGRVLAALLLLGRLHPDDAALAARYREVAEWGRSARTELPSDFDRLSQLIRVWDVHALLTPDPEVLEALSQLHVGRRDAALAAYRNPRSMMGSGGPPPQQVLALAPLDVAGVYLRHGDLPTAIAKIEAMGGGGPSVAAFVSMLRTAEQTDADGAEAILQVAEFYRQARPEVARGLCVLGRRRFQADGRFPACLARVAGDQQRYAEATAWYAEAIERAPGERDLYDEALAQLNQFIEEGFFESDPDEARALASDAERILHERRTRWPDVAPPVPEERFLFLLGMLEMNTGNPADARTRLEASVQLRPSPEALLALGQVLERTSAYADAARRYREALDLVSGGEPGVALQRAELLEHLGDALRGAGEEAQARRMFRQALELWSEAIRSITPENQALMEQLGTRGRGLLDVRRGVLLDKLERREEAVQAFHRALETAGNTRQVFATILAHLAVARPDPALATEVFREALRQTSLEPEWKVYFGLWLRLVVARSGQQGAPTPADSVFAQVAGEDAWPAQLARFASGAIGYDQLLGLASGRGQRAEALFYEGVRRLSEGDRGGARALFDEVLETGMVGYFEFIMAQELVRESEPAASGPQASVADPAAPAPAAP
jgi:tetratricopeptide (TPR) repeat protein